MRDVIAALPYEAVRLATADICFAAAEAAAGTDYEAAERAAIDWEGKVP
jgi:hypothetical protein